METDILIVGAGILGMSSAYYLKKRDPTLKVVLIDKLNGPAQGNSGKSEGAYRNLFTGEANYLLADSTIDWFHNFQEKMGYDIKLSQQGYIWLFSEEQYSRNKISIEVMTKRGAETQLYSGKEIKEYIPDLEIDFTENEESEILGLENIDIGVYGVKCGSLDADALVRAYEAEFLRLGGEIHYNTIATKLLHEPVEPLGIPDEPFVWQESRIAGVNTPKGRILAETTVVATGTWAAELFDPIGYDCFMRPKKRQLFAFKDHRLNRLLKVEGLNESNILPLIILPKAGIYLKGEKTEESIWLGCADELGRKFECEDNPQPEDEYYSNNIYHVLVQYLPCFDNVRPENAWAGQYDINSFDKTPVVEEGPGFIYIGASSGSGIMKCDALARIVEALYNEEEYANLYGNRKFKVSDISIKNRKIEKETLII
ncbi:FAD-binding oxidoreductase [Candidatus Bathyarchaeota archaeon]|nr:FAD-binding oxidoreductase [Candidatus Bathyarchaeota archaeon]